MSNMPKLPQILTSPIARVVSVPGMAASEVAATPVVDPYVVRVTGTAVGLWQLLFGNSGEG
jgi:hypothetical protein